MREKLELIVGQRLRFRATVEKFATKRVFTVKTVLLTDVLRADTNELLTDHVWLDARKTFLENYIDRGSTIEFNARVGSYTRGYFNPSQGIDKRCIDYRLVYPAKLLTLPSEQVGYED